jgi:hypothetical protein
LWRPMVLMEPLNQRPIRDWTEGMPLAERGVKEEPAFKNAMLARGGSDLG